METWRAITGWEGLYEVSDLGRVRRSDTQRIKVQSDDKGYRRVGLCGPGRKQVSRLVHRLVLTAFRGLPPEHHDGGHLDGDRANNCLSNLAWVSRADNQLHRHAHGSALWGEAAPRSKLSARTVAEIRALRDIVPPSELAQRYGVGRSTIQKIIAGQIWATQPEARRSAAEAALAITREINK